jgi:hypothetical protein
MVNEITAAGQLKKLPQNLCRGLWGKKNNKY